ncbi:hypothetical protein FBUS_07503, partial [Fasciolopsis buskii]
SDVCLELPFILTHPNPEQNRLDGREPDADDVFSMNMPAEQRVVKTIPDLSTPLCPPVKPTQTQQPPLPVNSLPSIPRPRSSSPTSRLHELPSQFTHVPMNGNVMNGDHRNPTDGTTAPPQSHSVGHRHMNRAVTVPGRAHTISGAGPICVSNRFPLGTQNREAMDIGGNVNVNTGNNGDVHTGSHYRIHHSNRGASILQTNRSSTLFSSVGHAVTLPLCGAQSSISSTQWIPSNDPFSLVMNSAECGELTSVDGLDSKTSGSLTHGPAPRPPTRHRFQSAVTSAGVGNTSGSSMYGSFKSERHPSLVGTQSTASEDDLMFEDFARLRLQSVTGSRKTQPSVF